VYIRTDLLGRGRSVQTDVSRHYKWSTIDLRVEKVFSKLLRFVIQVDICGHPPSPTGPKHVSDNFGNLLFLAVFNFQGHFEALKDVF
jgi:hypothetical protein